MFGYIFKLVNGVVSWRIAKQILTATSIMEAKFMSCFEASTHGFDLMTLLDQTLSFELLM